jgi:prevent-host-death family protein
LIIAISLTEDFKTVDEVQGDFASVLKHVHRTRRPLVVTKRGKPSAVIMDAETYEWKLHVLTLGRMLAEAEADLRAGKGRPIEEFFAELDLENKVSRHHKPRRRK